MINVTEVLLESTNALMQGDKRGVSAASHSRISTDKSLPVYAAGDADARFPTTWPSHAPLADLSAGAELQSRAAVVSVTDGETHIANGELTPADCFADHRYQADVQQPTQSLAVIVVSVSCATSPPELAYVVLTVTIGLFT